MISGGLVLLFCGIVIAAFLATAVGALLLLLRVVKSSSQSMSQQLKMIESLTKLAASKDISAFQALEATSSGQPIPYHMAAEPMDDESVARRMMSLYADRGIDPSLALSSDLDPLEDFGGTDALFGKSK